MLINAGIITKFLEWLHDQSNSPIMVGGISQGGLLGRIALLYSQPGNNVQNKDLAPRASGFLSIDAPQQGANIGIGLQSVVEHFVNIENESSAKGQWNDLNVIGAHQMIYNHWYKDGNSRFASNLVSKKFFKKIKEMGEYRKDMPKVSIAYSNFYKPHKKNIWNEEKLADIGIKGLWGLVNKYQDVTLKNTTYASDILETVPGSTGDWYAKNYPRRGNHPPLFNDPSDFFDHVVGRMMSHFGRVRPETINNELFKGTFIPIFSGLDIPLSNPLDIYSYSSFTEHELAELSNFDKVMFMKNDFNNYQQEFFNKPNTNSNDEKRYEHVVFDTQIMAKINQGIEYIEKNRPERFIFRNVVPTILMPLLLN